MQLDSRKRTAALITLAALVLTLLAPLSAQATETAKYTILVYLNGSDLESGGAAASRDLAEMMAVGSSPEINVVVETMGTAQWAIADISNERRQRWLVGRGRAEVAAAGHPAGAWAEAAMANLPAGQGLTLAETNAGTAPVGDPTALRDFIIWGVQNYPAEQYVLVFWNHGAGSVGGFGYDEVAGDPATLSLAGIHQGLAEAYKVTGQKFEIIGFDACLMATVETAHVVSPYARYLAASEELEPGHGWDYAPILQRITDNPDIRGDALGKVIADGFKAQAEKAGTAAEITLSVVDLDKVDEVVTALEAFVQAAAADIQEVERIRRVAEARRAAESYGNDPQAPTDMVDLGDLARHAAKSYPAEAEALLQAVQEAVVYKVISTGKPDGTGLSVYLPYANRDQHEALLGRYLAQTPFSPTYQQFAADFAASLFGSERQQTVVLGFVSDDPLAQFVDQGTLYTAMVRPESLPHVTEVAFVLAAQSPEDENVVILLERDTTVDFDPETGLVQSLWGEDTWSLDGHFVSMWLANESETSAEYMIPVLLNGRQVNIMAVWHAETERVDVVGAWPGIQNGVAQKEIIKLQPGDEITPLFFTVNEQTGEEGTVPGEPFKVSGPVKLELTPVPEGSYLYSFEVTDLSGKTAYTNWVGVELGALEPGTEEPAAEEPTAVSRVVRLWVGQTRAQVDGSAQTLDVPPQVVDGRSLVPLRFLAEALGAEVEWNGAEKAVTYTLGPRRIVLWVGQTEALVNGEPVTLDTPPVIVNGRTLVPLRFVSENLGATVEWIADEKAIVIRYSE